MRGYLNTTDMEVKSKLYEVKQMVVVHGTDLVALLFACSS